MSSTMLCTKIDVHIMNTSLFLRTNSGFQTQVVAMVIITLFGPIIILVCVHLV